MILTGLLLSLAVVLVLVDWRRALFIAVPVALLQDPLRKLSPDQPVIYVILVGVVIGAAAFAATMSGTSLMPNRIWGWRRYLAAPFGLFVAILIFQSFNSLLNSGNIILPLIGLSSYLTPFFALCLVYQIVNRSPENRLDKFFLFYAILVFLDLATIYLQYIGYDWSILGEVGQGIIIYDRVSGARLSAYSGLFRSSEVAAWHAATSVCFFVIWILNRRLTLVKLVTATILILAIVGLGTLTGRRKFLLEIVVFASAYATLLLYFGRSARFALLSSFVGLAGFLAFTLWIPDSPSERIGRRLQGEQYVNYVSRTSSVFEDITDRFSELGLEPIRWAYDEFGLLGAGLGYGSQGTQYFGASAQGASEGGLGKIWLELGAPGFAVIIWLGWAFGRHIWNVLKIVHAHGKAYSRVSCGLVSFLIANIAAFTVATQVYGDIFVLILIGTALGTLLAMPILSERAVLRGRMVGFGPQSGSVLATAPV